MAFNDSTIAADAAGLASRYAARTTTPVAVCDAYLERIDRYDVALGCFVTVDHIGARAQAVASARRWAEARPLSALDGCPVAIKANIAVAGMPWHAGIAVHRNRIATADAACVAALRATGVVILGLTNMDEAAFGATGNNPDFRKTLNPWSAALGVGGSSSGSAAAVAGGMCVAALGTDTLGSVRIPAALCGLYGHKPARRFISTEGIIALAPTLDHVGVLARSAEDCAALLAAAHGALVQVAAPGTRILAIDPATLADDIRDAFTGVVDTARASGIAVDLIALPEHRALIRAAVLVVAAECAVETADIALSVAMVQTLTLAHRRSARDLAVAYRCLAEGSNTARSRLNGYAALLSPTIPCAAPGADDPMHDAATWTALANIAGLPASAFPIGLTAAGCPLSAQIIGWSEHSVLALAAMLGSRFVAPEAFTKYSPVK